MKEHILTKDSDVTEHFSKTRSDSLTYILLQHHLKDPSFTVEDLHSHVNTFIAAVSLFMLFIADFVLPCFNLQYERE